MKAILIAALAVTLTVTAVQPALAQTTDSTRVAFLVRSIASRVTLGAQATEAQRAAALGVVIAGAVVSLQSGLVLGATDDSGIVVVQSVPLGRQQLNIRAKGYQPLSCRVNVRDAAADTVRILLIPERRVQVWEMAPGCRQRR